VGRRRQASAHRLSRFEPEIARRTASRNAKRSGARRTAADRACSPPAMPTSSLPRLGRRPAVGAIPRGYGRARRERSCRPEGTIRNAEVHRLDAGRDVGEDQPEETAQLVLEWLERRLGPSAAGLWTAPDAEQDRHVRRWRV